MKMVLVFASNNAHKLAEVRAIMPAGVKVLSLHEIGFEQEIDETGVTLEENSMIKARTVADFISSQPSVFSSQIDGVFADDTGWYLQDPGAKEAKTDLENFARNRAKALRELKDKDNRGCQFRTVITLIKFSAVSDQPSALQVEGIVRGRMATEEYGEGGFGYDPIFIPEGYDKTFGELPAELKNTISHRARALAELVKVIHD